MKKLSLIVGLIFYVVFMSAQTKIWDGGGSDHNFSTADNWNDDTAPAGGEDYLFNSTSTKSCNVDMSIDASSFSVSSGYTGLIDMGSDDHFIFGNFSIADGTVISTTGRLEFYNSSSSFVLSGSGIFNHNNGLVMVVMANGGNFNFSGNLVLNDLELQQTGTTAERIVNFGSNLTVQNLVLVSASSRIFSYQGNIHVKSTLDLGNNSHTSLISNNNTANFIFDGGSATLIGSTSTGAGKAYLPNIEINTSGNYSITRSLNVIGNWTGTSGTLTAGSSEVNMYGNSASISGTSSAFDNLTIQNGATVSFVPNSETKVGLNFTNNGSISTNSTSLLGLNGGSNNQTLSGNAFTFGSVRAYSGSRSISLNTGLTILDSIKVESGVTFASGGNLTLNADASLQGRVAELVSGASITGNVTVETFVPGPSTGWANWGISGVNSQSVSHWDAQIPMTCEGCIYGVTALGEYFESIQAWDPDEQTYDTTISSNTALTPGRGFWVYVGTGFSNTNPITLNHTGSLVQGTQTINVRNDGFGAAFEGYNLIANPFASPISWDRVWAQNSSIQNDFNTSAIYVYNADLGVTTNYVPGVGSSHANGIKDVIPVGQGFYVDVVFFSNVDLLVNESAKIDSNRNDINPILKTNANNTKFRLKIEGPYGEFDETLLNFTPQASIHLDRLFDARKIFQTPGYVGYPGSYNKYTTISTQINQVDYSINSLPALDHTQTIPVLVKAMSTGFYTLTAQDFQNFNSCLVLHDKLDGTYFNLLESPYIFHLSDTTNTPRFELMVCESGNSTPVAVKEFNESNHIKIFQDGISANVVTKFDKSTKIKIEVYNLLGQKLINDTKLEGTETLTRLPIDANNQVIFVKVSSNDEVVTKKLVLRQ